MKKILGALVCMLTLAGGAMQAKAALLEDWTFSITDMEFTSVSGTHGTVSADGNSYSFDGHKYSHSFSVGSTPTPAKGMNKDLGGDIKLFDVENVAAFSSTTKLTEPNDIATELTLANLTFSYEVASVDSNNNPITIKGSNTITLKYFYDGNGTEFIYYDTEAMASVGGSLSNFEDYTYSVTKPTFEVNERDVTGAENPFLVGWRINDTTFAEFNGAFTFDALYEMTAKGNDPAPTPEPATMLLMGAGLVGLGLVARRRNSK